MSVLITGGAGLVGLSVAEELCRRGLSAVPFDAAAPPSRALEYLQSLPGEAHVEQGDVTDRSSLDAAFDAHRVEFLVQGAAITAGPGRERSEPRRIAEVNLLGSIEAYEAARQHQTKRVVYLSSSSVYGENSYADGPLDEIKTAPLPDSLYAISKYAGERTALRFRALHGMDLLATRLSGVFGPWERDTGVRDTLSPIYQATQQALQGGEAVLSRPGIRDWTYGRDIAAAIVGLLFADRPAHAVYNIASGTTWSMAEWCERLATRFSAFRWRIGEDPTIDLFGPEDRRPLATTRLVEELDWRPAFGLDAAFEDYMSWLAPSAGRQ